MDKGKPLPEKTRKLIAEKSRAWWAKRKAEADRG